MTIKPQSLTQTQINSVIELYSNGQIQEALDSVEALIKDYPEEALLYNVSGACYAGLGQMDTAVELYEKSLTIKPDYAEAHNNLGVTLQGLGQLEEAIESYEQALTLKPDYAEAHYNLGNVLKDLGQLDTAIKRFKKALTIKPDYAEAYYSLGIAFQNLGQLEEAIKSYEEVLAVKSDFPEMYNNLGVTLQNLGQLDSAIKSFEEAVAIKPEFAEAQNNLGNILKDLGQLDTAVKRYKKALVIKPDYVEANYNLGVTLQDLGQLDAAVECYEKALTIKPDYIEAHNNLGVTLKDLGQLDAAVKSYEKALAIKPEFADAHYNLGGILQKLGQLNAAVESFEKALAIKPEFTEAHNNLGITLKELGQLDAAVKSYEKALTIKPDYIEAHNNLGNALKDLGQLDEAVKSYEKILTIKPDNIEAHNNIGVTLQKLGQMDASVKSFEKALDIKPDYVDAYNNLGITFMELGQHEAAVECYEKVLSIIPDFAEAYSNRGHILIDLKRLDEALASYERAIVLNPELDFILGSVLHTKMHLCIWNDLTNRLNELTKKINNTEKVIGPFALLAMIDDPEIQRKTAEMFIKDKYPKIHVLSKINRYHKHTKIRIGYFSADFRDHPVSHLTAELYETHDRKQFEIYAFSYGPDTKDEMNLRIKAGVDHFHDVQTMSHKDVVMLSRSVELDIAVDLGGFTQDSRTGIFAMQAAPIQVNYLGYSGTMGAEYIDYLIADSTLIPKDKQHYYSEKIAYLPNSFMVNDTKNKTSTKEFTRAEAGLPNDGFVFCCFNNHYKITPDTFIGWMRILSQVDGSVLWLPEANSTAVNNLIKEAIKNGVDENRLIFAPRLTLKEDHLNRIQLADLFIDTLPYNAHTTASDSLRMGLPVLTCIGNSFASRVAASLLNAVNLPELITTTQEQYESFAIELATKPEKLNKIKDRLVNNLPTTPLYNTSLFAQHLESAYLKMYEKYQQGLDPEHIYVEH